MERDTEERYVRCWTEETKTVWRDTAGTSDTDYIAYGSTTRVKKERMEVVPRA